MNLSKIDVPSYEGLNKIMSYLNRQLQSSFQVTSTYSFDEATYVLVLVDKSRKHTYCITSEPTLERFIKKFSNEFPELLI